MEKLKSKRFFGKAPEWPLEFSPTICALICAFSVAPKRSVKCVEQIFCSDTLWSNTLLKLRFGALYWGYALEQNRLKQNNLELCLDLRLDLGLELHLELDT
jgi:hypothetical protein